MEISEKKETKRPGAGIEYHVTNKHTIDDVIQAHRDGYSVTFSDDEDFINFSDEDMARLPKPLLVFYNISMKGYYGKLDEVVDTMSGAGTMAREFGYDKRVADPKEQLEVWDKAPGFIFKWVRAFDDQIAKYDKRGYIMAPGNACKTFANPNGKKGHHYVGSEDKPELVLMMISTENFKKNEARIKEASNLKKAAAKQQFVDQINNMDLSGSYGEVEGD